MNDIQINWWVDQKMERIGKITKVLSNCSSFRDSGMTNNPLPNPEDRMNEYLRVMNPMKVSLAVEEAMRSDYK